MNIGDILKKMGRATLTSAEQEAIRLWGNETQISNQLSSGMKSSNSSIEVDYISARRGFFDEMPFDGVRLMRDAVQSIPDAAYTKIIFDTVTYQKTQIGYKFFDVNVSTTDLYIKKTGFYVFCGDVRFTANASGFREVEILSSHTPFEDGSRGRVAMSSGGGNALVGTVLSFAGGYYFTVGDTVSVSVWQNTGGALTVDNIRFTLYRVL